MPQRMALPLLFSFLAPTLACADGISDLRGALGPLQGQEAVRAKVDIQTWTQDGQGKKAKQRQSHGLVQAEDGPQGLRLGWTPQQIQLARKEAQAKAANPGTPTPNLDALTALSATDAASFLNYTDPLLAKLERAQVLEDRQDSFQGRPARLVRVKLEPNLDPDEKDSLKSYESTMKIWIGADGIPVGLEESTTFKASKFLISFQGTHKESTSLTKVGNRLVVTTTTKESSGSGMGMTNQSKSVYSLSLF